MSIVRNRTPGARRARGRFVFAAVAAALAALLLAALCLPRGRHPAAVSSGPDMSRRHQRPSAAYSPLATPARLVEPPDASAAAPGRSSGGDVVVPADDPDDVSADDPAGPIPADDPELLAMAPERDFATRAWKIVESEGDLVSLAQKGEAMMNSGSREDRALGAVLLFFAGAMDDVAVERVLADGDPAVPLTLHDWVRDFGEEGAAATLGERIRAQFSLDEMRDFAASGAGAFGGARAALDLWLGGFPDGAIPAEELAAIVSSPNVSYDVRAQGLLKLFEPETMELGVDAASAISGGGSVLTDQFLEKLGNVAEIADEGDDCKIWDSQTPVVYFLAHDESALPSRDLANYLEYALRRDDPEVEPNIQEGTWQFANEYLEARLAALGDAIPPEEQDALDRIAASLDRLVEYDPAFNPFETVEENGEEDAVSDGSADDDAAADDDDGETDEEEADGEEEEIGDESGEGTDDSAEAETDSDDGLEWIEGLDGQG